EEARKVSDGKFLMVDVFEARYLSTYVDDQARFDSLMERVLTTPNNVLAGGMAMNDLAKVKARTYMGMKSDLF
ncbi:MAG: TRAP transporter TatT component family protein, partial [Pseudomonadota bacterium]